MKTMSIGCAVSIVLSVAVLPAMSAPLNGGFETGDFTSWTTVQDSYSINWFGGIQVLSAHGSYTADEGTYFAKLPVYSSMYQDMTWLAGDILTFSYAFEGVHQTAMGRVKTSAISVEDDVLGRIHLDGLGEATYWSSGNTNGWRTYTYIFPQAGTGHIRFWMSWVSDPGYGQDAYVYIDNVQHVPGPPAILLLAPGVVALLRRKR
jgi:hypothetical protein